MALETETTTIYQIRPWHHHEAVQAIIPADDAGGMVTDRGRSDEAQAFDRVEPHTCLAPSRRSRSKPSAAFSITKIGYRALHPQLNFFRVLNSAHGPTTSLAQNLEGRAPPAGA